MPRQERHLSLSNINIYTYFNNSCSILRASGKKQLRSLSLQSKTFVPTVILWGQRDKKEGLAQPNPTMTPRNCGEPKLFLVLHQIIIRRILKVLIVNIAKVFYFYFFILPSKRGSVLSNRTSKHLNSTLFESHIEQRQTFVAISYRT